MSRSLAQTTAARKAAARAAAAAKPGRALRAIPLDGLEGDGDVEGDELLGVEEPEEETLRRCQPDPERNIWGVLTAWWTMQGPWTMGSWTRRC